MGAIGGRGRIYGALLGAVLVNYSKTYCTGGIFAEFWLFMLGGLFVMRAIYMPKGVIGLAEQIRLKRAEKTSAAASQAAQNKNMEGSQ